MSEKRQPRRKTPLACQSCRNRRTKCDGSMPVCQACQRRGLDISQCVYTIENARTANRDSYIQSLHDRIRALEQTIERNGIGGSPAANAAVEDPAPSRAAEAGSFRDPPTPIVGTVTECYRPVQHRATEIVSPDSLESGSTGVENGVTAMGTLDHDGDISGVVEDSEHFYGSSSAASFMRQAVESANSPEFSPIGANASTGDTSTRQSQTQTRGRSLGFMDRAYSENYSLPPRSLADHLLSRFWEKVYYLYPVFHKPTFEDAYRHLWEPQRDESNPSGSFPNVGLGSPPNGNAHTMLFQCALNIIFAIGVSFSDIPPAEKEAAARTFFLRAKSFIGLDMLDINNIGLAQVMLLVTIFLQSTPFPSRCWHAIGIACRVAQGLGLHTYKPRRGESQLEIEISRRTWQGCVILDMTVSMTLGRPAMTTHLPEYPASVSYPETSTEMSMSVQDHEEFKMIFFVEYYRLCHLLRDILGQVYQGGNYGPMADPAPPGKYADDLTAILQLERRLLVYEESLPPILSWQRPLDLNQVSPTLKATTETQRLVLHRR
ncbi:hypothetical protein PFICI_15199 [Pestalotiopsis fici W106-1]|uniref:Zn(2)-C6 fungal-type domain-containing protein n=1 Tax=Pestalotiopsis fici (strain W106-1 / CGMCC3.15140) TaxID=1229662 RepID=W3WGU8_PESFW|nr:uncharacterized protein PFICI_15199 [Pestalotiopsis fici W106-1]ETS73024.1 hypothetical protein PFICI_15199 [Pestalotiopsis fici W106-1]